MLEQDLSQFTGTEQYFKHATGLLYTDGVKHLRDNGGAWLIDAIGLFFLRIMSNREMSSFCLWTLTKDNEKGVSILQAQADTGREPFILQSIDYSDIPIETLKLYQIDGVLLLPSEY